MDNPRLSSRDDRMVDAYLTRAGMVDALSALLMLAAVLMIGGILWQVAMLLEGMLRSWDPGITTLPRLCLILLPTIPVILLLLALAVLPMTNIRVPLPSDHRLSTMASEIAQKLGVNPERVRVELSPGAGISIREDRVGKYRTATVRIGTSACMWMSPSDLTFFFAHELAHFVCDHTQYWLGRRGLIELLRGLDRSLHPSWIFPCLPPIFNIVAPVLRPPLALFRMVVASAAWLGESVFGQAIFRQELQADEVAARVVGKNYAAQALARYEAELIEPRNPIADAICLSRVLTNASSHRKCFDGYRERPAGGFYPHLVKRLENIGCSRDDIQTSEYCTAANLLRACGSECVRVPVHSGVVMKFKEDGASIVLYGRATLSVLGIVLSVLITSLVFIGSFVWPVHVFTAAALLGMRGLGWVKRPICRTLQIRTSRSPADLQELTTELKELTAYDFVEEVDTLVVMGIVRD